MSQGIDRYILLLTNILEEELTVLKQILTVEEEKNQLLTTKRFVDISSQNDRLDRLTQEESVLEQRREALLNELQIYYNSQHLTLKEVITKLPGEQQPKLANLREELQQTAFKVKEYSDINQVIIADMLKLVGYSLDYLTRESNLETNYGNRNSESKQTRSVMVNAVI